MAFRYSKGTGEHARPYYTEQDCYVTGLGIEEY